MQCSMAISLARVAYREISHAHDAPAFRSAPGGDDVRRSPQGCDGPLFTKPVFWSTPRVSTAKDGLGLSGAEIMHEQA
jgi:hypothetical protein